AGCTATSPSRFSLRRLPIIRFDEPVSSASAGAIAPQSSQYLCDVRRRHAGRIAYVVMEYIEGEVLAQSLRRGPFPPATALRLAIQIATALDAAHPRGIIHRDLKPGNVIVADQTVKAPRLRAREAARQQRGTPSSITTSGDR